LLQQNNFKLNKPCYVSDCSLPIEQFYATRQDAEGALEYFTLKARDIESEPCQIQSEIQQVEDGYLLKAVFTFCCQAELVIFQMKLS